MDSNVNHLITHEHIGWEFRGPGRPEDLHSVDALVFELDPDHLRSYCISLQEDMRTLRLITSEAIARLADYHRKQQQLEIRLAALRDEIRRYTASQIRERAA
jgi:hypothetical protein